MKVTKKYLFVLIGNNNTGKTTFQKKLIEDFHGIAYESLKRNKAFLLKTDNAELSGIKISYINRSYQESAPEYGTIENYFNSFFNPQDVAVVSSHLNANQVESIIEHGKRRFYNVIGVFFSNSILNEPTLNADISALNWDERLIVDNPFASGKDLIEKQLTAAAKSFAKRLTEKML